MATIEDIEGLPLGVNFKHRGREYYRLRHTSTGGADSKGEYLQIPVCRVDKPSVETWITLRSKAK